MSRSEEAVKGEANCFVVRGVHRSVAKTLDGLHSGGYLQFSVQHGTGRVGYFLLGLISLAVAQEATNPEFHCVSEESASPQRGRSQSEHCELRERASEARRKGENL